MKQVHEGAVVRGRSGGIGNCSILNLIVSVVGVVGVVGIVVGGSWRREGRQFGYREACICDRLKNWANVISKLREIIQHVQANTVHVIRNSADVGELRQLGLPLKHYVLELVAHRLMHL